MKYTSSVGCFNGQATVYDLTAYKARKDHPEQESPLPAEKIKSGNATKATILRRSLTSHDPDEGPQAA